MSVGVELMIALRYLRARQSTRFASFISAASLLGIALGVAALITILSVMNGFERELRSRLLDMEAHVSVQAEAGGLGQWQSLRETILARPEVLSVRPAVTAEGMARAGERLIPLLAEGIDPTFEGADSGIRQSVTTGTLDTLVAGRDAVILGRFLALDLNVTIGDAVTLLVPRVESGQVTPQLVRFTVAGIFDSGVPEYDSGVAYVHWRDAARLTGLTDGIGALRITVAEVLGARTVADALEAQLADPALRFSDWSRENASYFRAIRLEKTMMALMLSLVIGVAAFNIVASLVMVVTDKETDIAILRTLGLSADGVVRVFFLQGLVIGWFGVILGVVGGTLLALNVTEVAALLERLAGVQVMPADVYVMTQIPSQVKSWQVLAICLFALLLTTLATLYPARQAARVHPAQALRYG